MRTPSAAAEVALSPVSTHIRGMDGTHQGALVRCALHTAPR